MRRLLILSLVLVLVLPVIVGCVVHSGHPTDEPTVAGPRKDIPRTTETTRIEEEIDRSSEFQVEGDE